MKLISVITIQNGIVDTVRTWEDSEENEKTAKEFFLSNCANDSESFPEEKVDEVLSEGYYEFEGGNYSVNLTSHEV